MITDLEINTAFCSYGSLVPSLQTHGKLAKVRADGDVKLFTTKELLFLQGDLSKSTIHVLRL